MSGETSTAQRVLDALVGTGILTPEQMANAAQAAESGDADVGRLLLERGLVSTDDVAAVLEEELGVPRVDLSSYAPEDDALALVPAAVAREHRLLPLFDIEGMLTVAVGDPADVFGLDEIAERLDIEIEPVLADATELLGAVVQYYGDAETVEAPGTAPAAESDVAVAADVEPSVEEEPSVDEKPTVTSEVESDAETADSPPAAPVAQDYDEPDTAEVMAPVAPAPDEIAAQATERETIEAVAEAEQAQEGSGIDLDVLAVADSKRVGVLVSDIVEAAVKSGASHIQVLPYKDDFFLVFRIKGRLEKIASAPLSMQGALVEGLKTFAKLSGVPSSLPALGRVRARYGDKDLAITVSAVPTVAGQRVVMTLRSADAAPRSLEALGMNEAEQKALHAMVERGRGLLLVCAPVAGGRSQTYYSLVARAAEVGKTVYSVERSIGYELPAVAQVMVTPGSAVQPSAYIAAGLRQDTDVIAIDSVQDKDDIQLAVEAAGRGRLVVATFPAGDIVSGVRRILDLGVEPHSLAAALTVAVGQRLVRTTCPDCVQAVAASELPEIPGLSPDATTTRGAGCASCRDTGFGGVTGIFEVLPFTEAVRAAVARGADHDELESAALSSGMRALVRSGVAKVETGLVSAEELARVLRQWR
jgi:type II secretory ATPase GspE/PulE/Tfp pilus assembly ATPase PilB-like protein